MQQQDLVVRAAAGDSDAFAALATSHKSLDPGASADLPFTATDGTFAIVCVRGVSETENPLAYYLVGPLQVRR